MKTRVFVLLRIRLANWSKWLKVHVFGFGKHESVFISRSDFEKSKHDTLFIAAIQFGRIVNAIRSCERITLRIVDWGRITDTKDRIELLFVLSSYVYEGVKEFFRREQDLKHLKSWSSETSSIEQLRQERDGRGSQYWQVIHDIRNKVSFHFLKEVIENSIDNLPVKDEMDFAIGRTPLQRDIIYSLGDDIVLQYVFGRPWMTGSVEKRIEALLNYLVTTSEELLRLMYGLIIEILQPIADSKRKVI